MFVPTNAVLTKKGLGRQSARLGWHWTWWRRRCSLRCTSELTFTSFTSVSWRLGARLEKVPPRPKPLTLTFNTARQGLVAALSPHQALAKKPLNSKPNRCTPWA